MDDNIVKWFLLSVRHKVFFFGERQRKDDVYNDTCVPCEVLRAGASGVPPRRRQVAPGQVDAGDRGKAVQVDIRLTLG